MPSFPSTPFRRARLLGLLAAVLLISADACAADPAPVEWREDWPRVRWWEIADVVALTVASLEIDQQWKTPSGASWKGGILFDDAARSIFRGRTASLQLAASKLGDILYQGSVYVPYLVDNYFAALWVHRNLDVALQMTLIDMQSLGIAGVTTLTAEHTIARERPFAHDCGHDGDVRDGSGEISEQCGHGDDYKSFYSGHAAAAATMAGLTCLHHQHLPLYGGGVADAVPCAVMIAIAAVTGMTRLVADRHWASDVVLGWGVGAISGYVIPSALHYGFGTAHPLGQVTVAGISVIPVPQVYPGGAGAAMEGLF